MQLPKEVNNSTKEYVFDTNNDIKKFLEKLKELISNIDSLDDNDKDNEEILKENKIYYTNYYNLAKDFADLSEISLLFGLLDSFTLNEKIKMIVLSKNILVFNRLLDSIINPSIENRLYKGFDKLYHIMLNKNIYLKDISNGHPYNKKARKEVFKQLVFISNILKELSYSMNNINDEIIIKSR